MAQSGGTDGQSASSVPLDAFYPHAALNGQALNVYTNEGDTAMKNTQEQMLEIMQKRERRRAAYWRRVAIMFYGTIGVIVVLAVYMGTR